MSNLAALLAFVVSTVPMVGQTARTAPPFHPGERMEYAVSYGPIPAGSMTIEIAGLENLSGRSAYHAVFRAQSNRAVSYLYELNSREDTWFDARELYSLRYRRTMQENDKTREKDVRFDQARNLRIESNGDSNETKPASPRAVDQLAMMYYLRTLPIAAGKSFVLRNQADPDDNPLTIRILKQERIRVPAGTFDTFVIDLDVKTDSGVFKKGGENRIWITTDARHVPVKITSRLGIGSFSAELVEYERGRAR